MNMSKKKDNGSLMMVYSTNPDFKIEEDEVPVQTLPPHQQLLRITLETKHRAGKTVTLVTGFIGTEEDMATLGKQLKNQCGTGGSAKDGEIILQGDHREKVRGWLQKNQYKTK
jgi:translation initiation factor 1